MAPHKHLQQHHGRSNSDGHQRAQSSTSTAGGVKAPYKRSEVVEAAATHNAQVASTSTSRVGRWAQEQRGRVEDSVAASDAEQMRAASTSQTGVVQQGQHSSGSLVTSAQQQADDPSDLPIFASILRAFEERGFCLMGLSPHHDPLRITATLAATTTNSASGGRALASLLWNGGNIAASLTGGHRAEATLPAAASLQGMGAGSCKFDGEVVGEEGSGLHHHHLLPAGEGSRGCGYGRLSTTQLEQIEETETDGGSVGDGSTTVQ